jgi:hypothetical protein
MNSRRILLIVARLLAFAAIAQVLAVWILLRSISTPIERHYQSAYFWSSLPIIGPSTVEVRLIWKTGRQRKQQLATDNDAVGSDDGTGMVLSQSARDAGWKSLIKGPPQQVPSELLSEELAGVAFEGQSLSDLLLLPELSALAALCAALCTWYLLMGFFRAMPSEFAWRRAYSALEELSSSLFEESVALMRRIRTGHQPLRRSAVRRIETHSAAPSSRMIVIAPDAKPPSFAIPLFGIYSGTGKGYLWTERDAIK